MAGMTETLAELHRLHIELQQVNEELARGPRVIKAHDNKVAQTQAQAQQLKEDLKQHRASADRKSLDLKTRESKLADLRAKLNACSSNREYDVLRGQIEADEVANSVLEDEILEFLEKVDRTQREIVETEEKAKQQKVERDQFAADFETAAAVLRQRVDDLQSRIREAEQPVSGETRDKYRRLVDAHGADGLASVDAKGVCTNCFVALTPQSMVLVNSGQIVFCSACGRLLYRAER